MKFLIKLLFCILAILVFLSLRTDAAEIDGYAETEIFTDTVPEIEAESHITSEIVSPETEASIDTENIVAAESVIESEGVIETDSFTMETESTPPETVSAAEWMSYIKNEVLPLVAMALSVVASVYVAISPAIYKIKRRSEDFRRATEGVTAATGAVEENRKQISRVEENLGEETKRMREELSECRGELERMNRILRIAFSNQEELVKKGVAMKIADIVHEKEREERKNERTES